MVADAQQQPQPAIPEDEAVKRNTDCVYFLASPLTCKKGIECEYRHSEYARVNPRDCWYWLNSACLNPKCAFRHPPIEGLLGVQAPQASGRFPVPSAKSVVVAPVTPATQSSGKQPVTCVFFQKGYCMKGDNCSFLHGPNSPTSAKPAQVLSAPPKGIESSNVKKAFYGDLQKCSQEQKIPHSNTAKSVVGAPPPHRADPISKPLTLPGNGFGVARSLLPIKPFDAERVRAKAVGAPLMNNGVPTNHRPNRVPNDHGINNGKEADEFIKESSPGFDVLVEDELRDEEYFHGDYDIDRPVSGAEVDPDRSRDHPHVFKPRIQGQYDLWDSRRDRDRKPIVPPQFDRRGYRKSINPDNIEGTDLRHQLSKHKRVNGLRSSIDRYDAHDRHSSDDRSHRSSRRDSQPGQQHKTPLSSRLRGRINLGPESRVDSELDRPRSSRSRSSLSTYEARFRDRLKGRVVEEVRNGRSSRDGREVVNYESILEFSAPPKGLSENKEPSILGKRKNAASQPRPSEGGSDGDVLFDGPMPLSEILKRKREASEREKNVQIQPGLDREEGEVGDKKAETIEDEKIIGGSNELEGGDGVMYDEAAVDDQDLDQAHRDYEYEEEEEVEEEEEEEEGEYEVEGEDEFLEDEEDDFAKKIGVLSS